MNFTEAKKTISAMGGKLERNDDDYTVWFGRASYYTDDLQDAVGTARHMAAEMAAGKAGGGRLKKSNPTTPGYWVSLYRIQDDGHVKDKHFASRQMAEEWAGQATYAGSVYADVIADQGHEPETVYISGSPWRNAGLAYERVAELREGKGRSRYTLRNPHHSPTPESLAARVALAAAAPTGMAVVTAAEIVDMVDRGVVDEAAEVVIDAVEEAGELIGSPVGDVVEDVTEEVEAMVNPLAGPYDPAKYNLTRQELAEAMQMAEDKRSTYFRSGRSVPDSLFREFVEYFVDIIKRQKHRKAVKAGLAEYRRGEVRRNPEPAASALYESFHGTPSTETIEVAETIREHGHLATLGTLQSVKIHTPANRRLEITFESDQPYLASNETGTQLYIVGGDQAVDLKSLGLAGKKWYRDCMLLGVLEEVTYRTKKGFHNFKLIDYYHKLGEETGVEPVLAYDTLNQKFSIIGGQYRVKPEGIVN